MPLHGPNTTTTSPLRSSPGIPHRVVALVGSVDRRAVTALDAGRLLGGDRLTALHVIEPGEDLDDLARRWMRLRCSTVPLRTIDAVADHDAVVRAVVDAVVPADAGTVVTVVMGQLQFARRWHRWLHDGTGARIAAALDGRARVHVLSVPIPVAA